MYQIPLPEELGDLFELGCGDVMGYWHDVGHAQGLENVGLVAHRAWLQAFGPRIVGVHLHDIRGLQDHLAAGLADMTWDMVAPFLPPDALRTCEFQITNTPTQVAAGIRLLTEKHILPAEAPARHGHGARAAEG